ncbi:MAG: energy transducer TonB [Spirochaetota bacterium]
MSEHVNDQVNFVAAYNPPPQPIHFFVLRPVFTYSLIWFLGLVALVYTFTLPEKNIDESEFEDLGQFEMIELEIPVPKDVEPEIELPEPEAPEVKTKAAANNLKFGDDSGKWDASAMAATAPRPRVALPEYPAVMKNQGIEGVVILEVGLDKNGNVVYGKIVKSAHPMLDDLVIDWARQAKFYPAIGPDGNAFKCRFFLPIRFALQ